MTRNEVQQLSDFDLIKELKKRLKKKAVIQLDDYFSNPDTDVFFEEIYNRYKKPIMSYCSKFIFDKDVISDIFHEIFINIYLNIQRFRYNKSLKAWIYRIAHNVSLNYISQRHHKEKTILNKKISKYNYSSDEMVELVFEEKDNIENKIMKKELNEKINEAFEKLPVDLKAVYILRKELGLNFEEVADIIGLSSRQIKTKYKQIILYIRSELEKSDITSKYFD